MAVLWTLLMSRTGAVAVQNAAVNPQALIVKGEHAAVGRERNGGKNLVVGNQADQVKFAAQAGHALALARGRPREEQGSQTHSLASVQ